MQIANPQGGGFSSVLGSSTEEPPGETITITAPDILGIRDTANASVTRRISYSHARTLVVSEELSRSGELLPALEGALRDRQVRRNISLIVSKEKASEFILGNKPKMESRTHKFYEDYNWMEKYPKAKVNVKFDVVIEGFGKQVEPPEIIK